jgi:hypothetical protein
MPTDKQNMQALFANMAKQGIRPKVTDKVAGDLKQLGIPNDAEIVQQSAQNVVICAALTKPLIMPNNSVCACAECGRIIQHRPYYAKDTHFICTHCATHRIDPH